MINTLHTQITFMFQGEHDYFLKILWAINSNHVIANVYEQIFDCRTFVKGKKIHDSFFEMSFKSNRMSNN